MQSRFVYDKKPELAHKPLQIKNDKLLLNFLRYLKNSAIVGYIITTPIAKAIEKQ
jgi:hypothetical protein